MVIMAYITFRSSETIDNVYYCRRLEISENPHLSRKWQGKIDGGENFAYTNQKIKHHIYLQNTWRGLGLAVHIHLDQSPEILQHRYQQGQHHDVVRLEAHLGILLLVS